jgi:hypothetical protein
MIRRYALPKWRVTPSAYNPPYGLRRRLRPCSQRGDDGLRQRLVGDGRRRRKHLGLTGEFVAYALLMIHVVAPSV